MSKHTSVCHSSTPTFLTLIELQIKNGTLDFGSRQLFRFQFQLRFWFPTIIKKDNQGKMIIIPNVTVWRQVLCSTAVPEPLPEYTHIQWNPRLGQNSIGCVCVLEWLQCVSSPCSAVRPYTTDAFFGVEHSAALLDSWSCETNESHNCTV